MAELPPNVAFIPQDPPEGALPHIIGVNMLPEGQRGTAFTFVLGGFRGAEYAAQAVLAQEATTGPDAVEGVNDLERSAARVTLRFVGLVETAAEASAEQDKDRYNVQAGVFNALMREIYGAPEESEARRLIRDRQRALRTMTPESDKDHKDMGVLGTFYNSIVGELPEDEFSAPLTEAEIGNTRLYEEFADLAQKKFGEALARIDYNKEVYTPEEMAEQLEHLIADFKMQYPGQGWDKWTVQLAPSPMPLFVRQDNRTFNVSSGTVDPETNEVTPMRFPPQEVARLITHEGTHAINVENGYFYGREIQDGDMPPITAMGLPGWEQFVELFAVLAECGITKEPHPNLADHYINVSLASGVIGGAAIPRTVLEDMHTRHQALRARQAGNNPDEGLSKMQINRTFMGGTTQEGKDALVNTQLLAYHNGLSEVTKLVKNLRQAGVPLEDIYDYFMLVVGDPRQASTRQTIYRLTGQRLPVPDELWAA